MQMGGGLRPPQPPRFFSAGQACVVLGLAPRHVTAMNSLLLETRVLNTKNNRRSERGGIALKLPFKKSLTSLVSKNETQKTNKIRGGWNLEYIPFFLFVKGNECLESHFSGFEE